MNPIYKFTLSANGSEEQQALPIYRDDLAKDFELQTNEEFYRAKLSGKLTFVMSDYDYIISQTFDTQFDVKIYISYDAGVNWSLYWHGNFWKTDCQFDQDNKKVTLTPEVVDQYTEVLSGMDKEYNLIDLAPEIRQVKLDKRPMIQLYVPGQTVVGCFLSGMWWEQECESITDENALVNTYKFSKNKTLRIAEFYGDMSPVLPDVMTDQDITTLYWSVSNGGYTLRYAQDTISEEYPFNYFEIVRDSDNRRLWYKVENMPVIPTVIEMSPVEGSGASGDVRVYIHDMPVYARYVCDVESAFGINTHPIPDDDIVENNRNYKRVIGYNYPNTIWFSQRLSETPTPWGLYKPGLYYDDPGLPPSSGIKEFYPVARNAWGKVSIWFAYGNLDWLVEREFRKEYTLRHAYPLASVISVLLQKIAPNITHQETADYSLFFYDGENPLLGISQTIFITPKSNMISLGYDQPAQKAPITLRQVLDMLRDCFRCYWFVDDQNRFRIEHIEYFRHGGSYTGTPVVGRDLTLAEVTRNGKKWSFGTSQYQYDKPAMAARYQFGWMDDVTQLFEGNPIDIMSKYVNRDNIEQINISQFTSDVDYILLNPGNISQDGFVLLSATLTDGTYKLPYYNFVLDTVDHILQNAYVAFIYLQRYYFFDMPAWVFRCNGDLLVAQGVKKLKTQTLKFPSFHDPNTLQLIKTDLGYGTIQKMSVNLSSRNANATLRYDTE